MKKRPGLAHLKKTIKDQVGLDMRLSWKKRLLLTPRGRRFESSHRQNFNRAVCFMLTAELVDLQIAANSVTRCLNKRLSNVAPSPQKKSRHSTFYLKSQIFCLLLQENLVPRTCIIAQPGHSSCNLFKVQIETIFDKCTRRNPTCCGKLNFRPCRLPLLVGIHPPLLRTEL